MMITISHAFKTFREDVNKENSETLAFFDKITSGLFKAVLVVGVPLLTLMVLFL